MDFAFSGFQVGHTIQPASDNDTPENRGGVTGQKEKDSLESIFDVLIMVQDVQTDLPDEPTMSLKQGGNRILVTVRDESRQQLLIGQVRTR